MRNVREIKKASYQDLDFAIGFEFIVFARKVHFSTGFSRNERKNDI